MGSYYSNKSKFISQILLSVLLFLIVVVAALVYFLGYSAMKQKKIDGAPYLPNLKITYEFADQIMYSSFSSVVVLIFGILCIFCKNRLTSTLFCVVCLCTGGYMIYTSQICFNFEVITSTMIDEICT